MSLTDVALSSTPGEVEELLLSADESLSESERMVKGALLRARGKRGKKGSKSAQSSSQVEARLIHR